MPELQSFKSVSYTHLDVYKRQQEPIELTGNEKWVAFDKKTKENNATVYIEEDTLNKVLTNSGLRGLYDKGSDGPNWNDVRLSLIHI